MTLLTRHGTLTDLAIEMRLSSELSDELRAEFDAHIADHPACRARFEAARAHQQAFDLPMPAQLVEALERVPHEAIPAPANNSRWMLGALASAAAVAATAMIVVNLMQQPPDVVTLRGAGLRFDVVLDDGAGGTVLSSGDAVHEGDRLGFRVQAAHDGYLMVLGVDQTPSVYAGYPSRGAQAQPFSATEAQITLPDAIRLDATPGFERLLAVHCPGPFTLSEVERVALEASTEAEDKLPDLLPGCTQQELLLRKESR